jgi:hypothetical protein
MRIAAIAAGGVALIILAVVGIVVATGGKDPKPAVSSETTTATAAPSAASSAHESSVEVAIDVSTPNAKISVDGKDVGKGKFRATVPKDARNHDVVVSADGYVPETRTIGFDRDVRLELALKPANTIGHFPVGTAVPQASNSAGAGTDLRVQQRPKHNIDDKDPY